MNEYGKALLIIQSIEGELALGTKHYSNGKLLTTTLEILRTMQTGTLAIEPSPERRRVFEELAKGNLGNRTAY